jgi:hypothetical protein
MILSGVPCLTASDTITTWCWNTSQPSFSLLAQSFTSACGRRLIRLVSQAFRYLPPELSGTLCEGRRVSLVKAFNQANTKFPGEYVGP